MKKYTIEVSWSEEDLAYRALVAELPGCSVVAASESEAQSKIQRAIDAWLAAGRAMAREQASTQFDSAQSALPAPTSRPSRPRKHKPSMQFTLAEAATRQLNAAISLFFAGGDPVVVHTLAVSAGRVFERFLERARARGQASLPAQGLGLPRGDYLASLARSGDFFAAADPCLNLAFDGVEDLLALALADCAEVQPLSKEMRAFQSWYRAVHASRFGPQPLPPAESLGASFSAPALAVPLAGAESLPKKRKLSLGRRLLDNSPQPIQFSLLPM